MSAFNYILHTLFGSRQNHLIFNLNYKMKSNESFDPKILQFFEIVSFSNIDSQVKQNGIEIHKNEVFDAEIFDIEDENERVFKTHGINLMLLKNESLKNVNEARRGLKQKINKLTRQDIKNEKLQIKIQKYHELNWLRDRIGHNIETISIEKNESSEVFFKKYGLGRKDFS